MPARTLSRNPWKWILFAGLAPALGSPAVGAASPLMGQIEGGTYVSATGLFKIPIPVSSELGGTITDTSHDVTFQDHFTTYLSIAVFPMDATQRWEFSVQNLKEYLIYFFTTFVRPEFQRSFPKGVQWEPEGMFIPTLEGGSFLTYVLLPGGSMFPSTSVIDTDRPPATAKRGNLVFVRNGAIFVVSIELGERATEGTAYNLSAKEEDSLLRERLTDAVNKMIFLGAAAAPATPAAGSPAPSPSAR